LTALVAQVTGGSDFDFPWNDKAIASEWLDTTPDAKEIPITLRSGKSAPVDSLKLAALGRLLEHCAQLWSLGNPEEPAPRDVLHGVHQILWRGRFAPRPPSRLPFEDPWN
jgi:hypothetical protein